jgi:hypothetical protein
MSNVRAINTFNLFMLNSQLEKRATIKSTIWNLRGGGVADEAMLTKVRKTIPCK